MRHLFLALAAVAALTCIDTAPAAAQDYPYCIRGRDYTGYGECSFPSYAACQAAASGRFAYCDINPFYHRPPEVRRPHRRVYREVY
jgi:hypothetical protein